MKKFVAMLLLVMVMAGLMAVDHLRVNKVLKDNEARIAMVEEAGGVLDFSCEVQQEAVKFGRIGLETVRLQAAQMYLMEKKQAQYNAIISEAKERIDLLEKALESATVRLRDLIDDNSDLEAELDSISVENKNLSNTLDDTRNELLRAKDRIKTLEQLIKLANDRIQELLKEKEAAMNTVDIEVEVR